MPPPANSRTRVQDLGVHLLGQHLRRVKHVPIGHKVGADLRALGLHGVDEGIDHCGLGGKLPEDLADLRELCDTVCRCDTMSDADQELQLYL